jgi:hypothetical protein
VAGIHPQDAEPLRGRRRGQGSALAGHDGCEDGPWTLDPGFCAVPAATSFVKHFDHAISTLL